MRSPDSSVFLLGFSFLRACLIRLASHSLLCRLMWLHFPCLIVVDHIEQHTAQIRAVGQRGMHRGPSPNAMMWSVHQAHEVVTKLSRLLTPTVLMFCTAMAVNASNWVVYVALPRQHVDVNPRFTQFLGVSVQIALATWSLHGAANCSAACDELLHAITELKVARPKDIVRCAAQPRRVHCWLNTRRACRLDGVRGYAQGLNSNQGLGFCFLGQRVPRDFVWRTIVRGCVLMCSVLGLGLLALGVVTRPALDRSQMLMFLVRAFPGLCLMG